MKKLLIGLTLLASVSSFAEDTASACTIQKTSVHSKDIIKINVVCDGNIRTDLVGEYPIVNLHDHEAKARVNLQKTQHLTAMIQTLISEGYKVQPVTVGHEKVEFFIRVD